jgi:acyl-[acyl-carrier-protein]-phospholipid O-acyltransferase / long-chain-fatty-acid--[acyl-carrier-protein] ligase
MKTLFKRPGALPYLMVVLLNAFVDLGHKITIQNTVFKIYDGNTQIILTAVVNGLILLPFILLFSPAGFIGDRYPKNAVMRVAAWAAVFITAAITVCYYLGWFWPAFVMTFLLGIQSAIYSPAKYGYIKTLFGKDHLAEANGLVQAVTIGAILLGTFVFSILFESMFPTDATQEHTVLKAIAPIGWLLVINSLFELVMAYRLPQLEQGNSGEEFKMNDYLTGRAVIKNIRPITSNETIRLSVIGLAVFWSVGQVLLAAFPAFAKENLAVTNTIVIQGILAATGIGIAIGSTLAGRWSKGHIETGLIPIGAAGISIGLLLLTSITTTTGHFINFLFIGMSGGLFIVPLNALIQFSAKNHELGKVIAGNNLVQNISMFGFLLLTVLFSLLGYSSATLLLIISFVALIGGLYTIYKLPQSLIRIILTGLLTRRYKINVQNMHNIPSQGGVLLLGNHISWIDWAIVQIASPRPIRFVMLKSIYERWYLKWFLDLVGCIPIQSGAGSQQSLETVARLLDEGEVVCLFPEGSISRTGHLAEFKKGYQRACDLAASDIVIVPFYLRGLWGSQFSRSSDQLKTARKSGLVRDIIVAFGAPLPKETNADVLKRRVFDLSIEAWHEYVNELPTIAHAWIDTVKRVDNNMAIADTLSDPLSATQALSASIAFSKRIKKQSTENNIGLLLPTSGAGVIANMAVLLAGKTIVNLNYSSSQDAISSAIKQAGIKSVYTSRTFLKKLEKKGIDLSPALTDVNIIYLEELKSTISKAELVRYWLAVKILPAKLIKPLFCRAKKPEDTAAILFSSGSEGSPKGIMLSHRNIMANLKQISDVLNTQEQDVVMASLPLFHALGLTVTQFMPLIEGIPMVCHADPTDSVNIAKATAKYRATLLFGTSTFLRLYTKNSKIHPLMLDSLRLVIAGAERLNENVRESFQLKFNKPILEGYGATETTPVASVNLPDTMDSAHWHVQVGNKKGSVGMPLPGSSVKIVDIETEEELPTGEEGLIMIGGAQVMQGYLDHNEKTAEVIREIDGQRWYITGDKGKIDRDGFLTIIDRYSRFAKIGGEMVGLSVVEEQVRKVLVEQGTISELDEAFDCVATAISDEKKGEVIVLLFSDDDGSREIDATEIKSKVIQAGYNPLTIPSLCLRVDSIPKLGSGKTDFNTAKKLGQQMEKSV